MRLPPLASVRFFEAAARHLSVRAAAAELHVTPGAVSQQVRRLEDFLGCALFERLPRGLALTPAGRDYLAACAEALALVGHATARLQALGQRRVVRLSCTAGFAVQWLVPRLEDFSRVAPDVDVHVSTTDRVVDLASEDIHFAVRHGLGVAPGLQAEVLVADDLVPVCSPRLIAPRRVPRITDITGARLLHDGHRGDWRLWCEANGAMGVDCSQGVVFTHSNGTIEAALAGRGFALARQGFVAQEIAARTLVAVRSAALATPLAYRLVHRPEVLVDPALRSFRDWITAQAAAF
ncbi:LysR substrate-binding domain-containing protein [Paracidovorax avenae]|uniref:LysR substrate-binding domain-containing protein n=1 Tax=Paracidovorax avenae TaxID=80867 RepID=UPI000D211E00|nr:LysR substrate-binding domain-containing protein [Paracidovorax avenae]AVT14401.1 LysR family transcriptional regulator [Paracidovorax avenae]